MPAIQNIVLNDGQATPAAHTFAVKTTDGRLAQFLDRSTGQPIGFGSLKIEVADPKTPTAALSHRVGFMIPVLATSPTGQTIVDYQNTVSLTFNFSQKSTVQDRRNLFAYIKNLLADSTFKGSVENGEPYF